MSEPEFPPPPVASNPLARTRRNSIISWIPWAIAAALVVCGVLWFRPAGPTPTIAAETPRSDLSIVVLHSTEEGYSVNEATVTWNSATQSGVLKLTRMPRPGDGQDYQLWVIDPQYETPVDGGVFAVDEAGNGELTFHPKQPIATAKGFAISLEPRGGSESAHGPIVMASR